MALPPLILSFSPDELPTEEKSPADQLKISLMTLSHYIEEFAYTLQLFKTTKKSIADCPYDQFKLFRSWRAKAARVGVLEI